MSGFLERLVAGSRRPSSIKPILGSVFMAPQQHAGIWEEVTSGQVAQRNDGVVAETRREDAAEESVVAAPPRETRPAPSSLETSGDDRQSIPIVRQKAEFEPLVTTSLPSRFEETKAPSAGG